MTHVGWDERTYYRSFSWNRKWDMRENAGLKKIALRSKYACIDLLRIKLFKNFICRDGEWDFFCACLCCCESEEKFLGSRQKYDFGGSGVPPFPSFVGILSLVGSMNYVGIISLLLVMRAVVTTSPVNITTSLFITITTVVEILASIVLWIRFRAGRCNDPKHKHAPCLLGQHLVLWASYMEENHKQKVRHRSSAITIFECWEEGKNGHVIHLFDDEMACTQEQSRDSFPWYIFSLLNVLFQLQNCALLITWSKLDPSWGSANLFQTSLESSSLSSLWCSNPLTW